MTIHKLSPIAVALAIALMAVSAMTILAESLGL